MYEDIIAGIAEKAKKAIPVEDIDYYENGLLMCGICHTPKEHIDNVFMVGQKVRCLCDCMAAKRDADEERLRRGDRLDELKTLGFADRVMQSWTFANDDGANERLTKAAHRYVEHFAEFREMGRGLLLYGTVGTGKSFAAACIVNALIEQGIPCMMTSVSRVVNSGSFEERQAYIDGLDRFDLLVLDDLAAERDTEYMGEMMQSIIDARYRAKKPLIVTTNLTADELKRPADIRKQRLFSRLYDMCVPIEVKGVDRRKQNLNKNYDDYARMLGLKGD